MDTYQCQVNPDNQLLVTLKNQQLYTLLEGIILGTSKNIYTSASGQCINNEIILLSTNGMKNKHLRDEGVNPDPYDPDSPYSLKSV